MDGLQISCIERVLILTKDLKAARQRWMGAGFAVCEISEDSSRQVRFARFAAGAITLELYEPIDAALSVPLGGAPSNRIGRCEGVTGWIWGCAQPVRGTKRSIGDRSVVELPEGLPGTITAAAEERRSFEERTAQGQRRFGPNPNRVAYLDHVVIMVPDLGAAITAQESIGLPCRRVREAAAGVRQAFFKLEQTVLEVVGPAANNRGVWGLAFMSDDIDQAVAIARAAGLQATAAKSAVQGGRIARIVEPLGGVAVAFMEAPSPEPTPNREPRR
ncbi:MAG TPA: VOC family protein [Candidatus Binataceae bacterium]|jgi:predicted enzyme related to lactoylglutathione lyase